MLPVVLKRWLTFRTHRIYNLPVIVMMPHSRCNCRCVMCDIWKANHDKKELSVETLSKHVDTFKSLGVREIVFSGGEALMHSNLWNFCALLKNARIKLTLLSTGLLLERNAEAIVENFGGVIVSVDGSAEIHDNIRRIPDGYRKISSGIKKLKELKADFPVTARCVLQRYNFFDFDNIVRSAKEIGLDQISFLAADVSSAAFNREVQWEGDRIAEVALSWEETEQFSQVIENSFKTLKDLYDSKFIAESPAKMRKLVQYYKAINGSGEFPTAVCNAPWVSAVIESDGNMMPCFFHKPYGNIYDQNFLSILNSKEAIDFRRTLDMSKDEHCKKCVCSLKLGLTDMN